MTDQAKPKRKSNLKIALGLGGACLLAFAMFQIAFAVFQTFAIKKLIKTTECIQVRQANAIYGIETRPDGDDENSQAIRDSLDRCNITLPTQSAS